MLLKGHASGGAEEGPTVLFFGVSFRMREAIIGVRVRETMGGDDGWLTARVTAKTAKPKTADYVFPWKAEESDSDQGGPVRETMVKNRYVSAPF